MAALGRHLNHQVLIQLLSVSGVYFDHTCSQQWVNANNSKWANHVLWNGDGLLCICETMFLGFSLYCLIENIIIIPKTTTLNHSKLHCIEVFSLLMTRSLSQLVCYLFVPNDGDDDEAANMFADQKANICTGNDSVPTLSLMCLNPHN